jgi:hypothetical protein
LKVYSDGDIRVVVDNTSWTLNPGVLIKKTNSLTVKELDQTQADASSSAASSAAAQEGIRNFIIYI